MATAAAAAFTITAPPSTDIWRKPPTHAALSAPFAHLSRGPLRSLRRARLTATLPRPLARLVRYDQAGLFLAIAPPGADLHCEAQARAARWVKAGVEVVGDEAWVSTVGCETWSDASLVPWGAVGASEDGALKLTVEMEREEGGRALCVYLCVPATDGEGETRVPLREVTWWFADEEGAWEVSVAAYAARPGSKDGDGEEGLDAEFEGLEVEWV